MISKTKKKKVRRYLEKFPVAGSIFLRAYKLLRSITSASLHKFRKSATSNTQSRSRDRALSNKRDWDFFSGERQTAECVGKIRKDHVDRYMYISNFIKNNVNATKLVSILDIFCGNGYGSYILASEVENVVVDAIDGSEEAIDFAKKNFALKNITYHHYVFPTKMKIRSKYDFTVSLETIEHVENDMYFYDFLLSKLKDNGVLFLSFPNKDKLDLAKNPNPFHFRHYNKKDLEHLIHRGKHKVEIVDFCGQDVYFFDEEEKYAGIIDESNMVLIKGYEGQFLILALRRLRS